MGWFCNEIIAQPFPRLFDALRDVDEIAERFFFVEAVPGRKPNFPPGGLAFIRDIGPPSAFWIKLSWSIIPERQRPRVSIAPEVPKVATLEGGEYAPSPPERFLRYLKWLSADSGAVVAYYSAFSWGGPLECEYAWIFDPWETVYCDAGSGEIRVYQEDDLPWQGCGDVLVKTLERLGVDSPEWGFLPHTSSFPWKDYKA
jgi:hypothetical protein